MRISGVPTSRAVWIDDRPLSPARSQRVWNHSPDGFNWGYEGSGPAQLALAILLAAGLPKDRAVALHQQFKREIIAPLPIDQPFVIELDVAAWSEAAVAGRRLIPGEAAVFVRNATDEEQLTALREAALARGVTFWIETVAGVEAIRCLFCNRVSELPGDVTNRYCGRCHVSHDQIAEGRRLIARGGSHDCGEWRTSRGCALCGGALDGDTDARR